MGTDTNPTNDTVAATLERVADLLETQDANVFRVRAYRRAGRTVREQSGSVADMAAGRSDQDLEDLPGIGSGIAGSIRELVDSGSLGLLQRLQGEVSPEDLFTTVPGVGEALARRIHAELDIDTLEDLELAAHDGRVLEVHGIGRRRADAIRDTLAARLSRSTRRRARRRRQQRRNHDDQPAVGMILDVDREYRTRAHDGSLKTIAPKRFNPSHEAWLPILHTERGGWSFSALFSNTAKAHELDKTNDWVVIYYDQDGEEDQCTVVTETHGDLEGNRVVRGRENECRMYYGSASDGN